MDAFHPQAGWYGPDVLGIDLGIMLLMAENLRTRKRVEEDDVHAGSDSGIQGGRFLQSSDL